MMNPLSECLILYLGYMKMKPIADRKRAFEILDEAIKEDSGILPLLYFERAELFMDSHSREYKKAILDLTKALEIMKGEPLYEKEQVAGTFEMRSRCFRNIGDLDNAIRDASSVVKLFPDNENSWVVLGGLLNSKGEKRRAVKVFSKYLKKNPSNCDILCHRALVYWEMGKHDKAIRDLKKCFSLDKNHPKAFGIYIELQTEIGSLGEVFKIINKRIKSQPDNDILYNLRGMFCGMNLRRHDWAKVDFEKAIRLNPGNSDYYQNLGGAFDAMGDVEGSIMNYSKCLSMDPSSCRTYYTRGMVYYKLKKFELALSDFQVFGHLQPYNKEFMEAYFFKAVIHCRNRGEHSEAEKELLRLKKIDPLWYQNGMVEIKIGAIIEGKPLSKMALFTPNGKEKFKYFCHRCSEKIF